MRSAKASEDGRVATRPTVGLVASERNVHLAVRGVRLVAVPLVETEDVGRVGIGAAWHEGNGVGAGDVRENDRGNRQQGAAYLVDVFIVLSCLRARPFWTDSMVALWQTDVARHR